MWLAGLRGAMAYALAIKSVDDFPEMGDVILVITLLFSLITIIFIGSIINPVLTKLNVK
jgi:NhaP-type Na+/H+ or K+/H+ antiporter